MPLAYEYPLRDDGLRSGEFRYSALALLMIIRLGATSLTESFSLPIICAHYKSMQVCSLGPWGPMLYHCTGHSKTHCLYCRRKHKMSEWSYCAVAMIDERQAPQTPIQPQILLTFGKSEDSCTQNNAQDKVHYDCRTHGMCHDC